MNGDEELTPAERARRVLEEYRQQQGIRAARRRELERVPARIQRLVRRLCGPR